MYVQYDKVEWEPNEEYDGLTLVVTGPNDTVYTHDSNGREIVTFFGEDDRGNMFPDGAFTYEPRVRRELSQEEMELIAAARLSCESLGVAEYKRPLVQTGELSLVNGEIVFALPENPGEYNFGDPEQGRRMEDNLIYDDLIVTGSECIGFDCSNGMSFSYDTLVLKEHNLRIYFNDTSHAASYPTRNWRIQINSQDNGGGSWFAIQDVDAGATPFKIEGDAPGSALYVDDKGRVGFGTSTPVLELHVKDGDTPSLRLNQDASYGWDAQTWDVCGNESNFFIRDATNGSKLPFRIQPGAPSNSITIRDDGFVGIGTWSPARKLDIYDTGSDARVAFHTDDTGTGSTDGSLVGIDSDDHMYVWNFEDANIYFGANDTTNMIIESDGELAIGRASASYPIHMGSQANNSYLASTGVWHDSSSREYKENIEPLRVNEAMETLEKLEPVRFNYKVDKADGYVGFIAEDVPDMVATKDRKTLVPMDIAAVLTRVVQEQQRALEEMKRDHERRSAELAARIVELERRP
ncbi:MAG: tail fiber domain-containing protein [Desulfobacterales bacterium]|nr:tail fiber domain-containing protein [Desulfobacterales bacterium]